MRAVKCKNPPLDVCIRCGRDDHGFRDCHVVIRQCNYRYCMGQEREHALEVCRDLHRICEFCYLRGHPDSICPLRVDPGAEERVKRHFEEVADRGCLTRRRHRHPAWGIYFFYKKSFDLSGPNDGLPYTYNELLMAPVRRVQEWIAGRRTSIYRRR